MTTYPQIAYVLQYELFKGTVKPDDDLTAVMEHAAEGLLETMGEIPELTKLDLFIERYGVDWKQDKPAASYVFYLGEWHRMSS